MGDIVAKMLEVKKRGGSKSELRELVAQMFLNFISLLQENRSILLEEDRVKLETEKAKESVDFTTLQLHNLMYEKNHCVKAIKACKDFKSKYPDIELVSEEEFLKDAPEEIKGATISYDNEHNVMLKRLNYELHERKELCKLKEQLEQKKKDLQETITNRNNQKEAFEENIDLEIVGSLKDAQLFARQQAMKENANVESSRLDDDANDDEDDGQIRRKRPKKAISGKDGLDEDKMYQAHPLKVILYVFDDEESESKNLNIVCVGIEGSDESTENNILYNLFPDDAGVELRLESAKLFVSESFVFDEKRKAHPYKWAQHLGGIDFLPESAIVVSSLSLYRQQNWVQTFLQRLRSRKKAQLALQEQLDALLKLKWSPFICANAPWALQDHSCDIQSCSRIDTISSLTGSALEQMGS
uniref:THO complex subunit 5 n=1 Tax=Kalanchoe fedtschenkoi TaxID=63787 RepID=A0A7N0U212_KALFE